MKKISAFVRVYLWLVILSLSISAQDFKTIQDGIEYAELEREIDKRPVKMNLLRLDLTKVRLDVVHALDAAIGTETVSSMATRHGAIAAINAGFFRLDKSIFAGDAAGVLQIDGKLLSETHSNRIALMIFNGKNKTEIDFDHLNLFAKVVVIGGKSFDIAGWNREREEGELIIFTPEFNRTTLTKPSGLEIVVRNYKITQIFDNKGSNAIPSDGFIISVDEKIKQEILKKAKVGDKVSDMYTFFDINVSIQKRDVSRFGEVSSEDITNGVPQLIKNGKIEITWKEEKTSEIFRRNAPSANCRRKTQRREIFDDNG